MNAQVVCVIITHPCPLRQPKHLGFDFRFVVLSCHQGKFPATVTLAKDLLAKWQQRKTGNLLAATPRSSVPHGVLLEVVLFLAATLSKQVSQIPILPPQMQIYVVNILIGCVVPQPGSV